MKGKVFILAGALALTVLSASQTIATVAEKSNPGLAMMAVPENGRADARAANLLVIAASAGRIAAASDQANQGAGPNGLGFPTSIPPQATDLAKEGFRLDPTATEAITVLGFAESANGETASARRLFVLANRMTRRDPQANLWLGTDLLRSGNVAGGLRYYDVILRTNAEAAKLILDRMVASLTNPDLVQVYSPLLSRHPDWEGAFWEKVLEAPGIAANASRLRLYSGLGSSGADRETNATLLTQIVEQGDLQQAADFYRALSGQRVLSGSFTDDFRQYRGLPPYDWQLFDEGGLSSAIIPKGGGLLISAVNGAENVALRRLLKIPAGRYQLKLAGVTASSEEFDMSMRMNCFGSNKAKSLAFVRDGNDWVTRWDTGANSCSWQFLELVVSVPMEARPADIVIKRISLKTAD